jgi:hypothetical protein
MIPGAGLSLSGDEALATMTEHGKAAGVVA